jgi:hypothetical protein
MPASKPGQEPGTTLRQIVDMLLAIATDLPAGLDGRIEFGVCDGNNLQIIDHVDLDLYTEVKPGERPAPDSTYVILRAHHHPGESPGHLLRGAAADADKELRQLTAEDVSDPEDGTPDGSGAR